MVVMPSNNSGLRVGYLCGKYPGRLGWLIGPGGWRTPPAWMPVALDNGAYGAWDKGVEWQAEPFWNLLETACSACKPLWAVVPDVVCERDATIAKWHEWSPKIRAQFPGLPLAFAVQDGMTPSDVPEGVHTVFIGGSFEWKWHSLPMWAKAFRRVHVARVNTERLLWQADRAGAVSCDGTGWMRGDEAQFAGLQRYLDFSSRADGHPQMVMESLFT